MPPVVAEEYAGADFERQLLPIELHEAAPGHHEDDLLVAVVCVLADEATRRHRLRAHRELVVRGDRGVAEQVADVAIGWHRLPVALAFVRPQNLCLAPRAFLDRHRKSPPIMVAPRRCRRPALANMFISVKVAAGPS